MRRLIQTALAAAVAAALALPARANWPPIIKQEPPQRYGDWELTAFAPNLRLPYYVHRYHLTYEIALALPALARRDFAELPAGTRFPISRAPDFPDLGEARWRAFRFANFRTDAFPNLGLVHSEEWKERDDLRYLAYRSLPRQGDGRAVPHQVDILSYGALRIPVLNYSPDMVTGAPCMPSAPRGAALQPKVTLDADGLRFPGAAVIPDDPCITQQALDLAVFALSHASPDRPMKDFLAGLQTIARRPSTLTYGLSDPARFYRMAYLEQEGLSSWYTNKSPAAGGGMFFLPPLGHENKRLYWLLVHPPGDPRLRPIAYPIDDELAAKQVGAEWKGKQRGNAGYWRVRPADSSGKNLLGPWIGRVGIPFVLYSPDEAVVCGRDPMPFALLIGAPDPRYQDKYIAQGLWYLTDFGHVACEFAAGPTIRASGGPLLTAVVYLFWEARQNRWVFDEIAVGSSAWSPLAGITRYTFAMHNSFYQQMHQTPAALVMHALPSFSGYY